MLNILLAMTALSAAQATPAAPAAAPARTLQSVPGITIKYYDVVGKTGNAIRKSMARQRPKGANGEPIAASTNWNLDAANGVKARTENGQCKIVEANLKFTATAELPRLTTQGGVSHDLLESWKNYVAGLESTAAAELWAVHDRLPDVQKAILASPCDGAGAAMTTATEQLKIHQSAARTAALAKLKADAPQRDRTTDEGVPEGY